jgi:hypothetical protein
LEIVPKSTHVVRRNAMDRKNSQFQGFVLAAGLGAVGGGLLVAIVTKAIPRMMSKMMSGMMENMMSQMGAGECDPVDI